jgi:hypothetical protein
MKCEDLYCRIKARERLKEQGKSPEEAKEISDDVYNTVKRIWDKYNGK